MYAFHHSPIKLVRPGRLARPRAHDGAAVFKTARSTVPRTATFGRGGRIRTGTGNHAQRILSPPCLRSNHAAINWCGQRESHPHEPIAHRLLGPARLLFRHVRKKMEHPQGRAPRSLPYHGSPSLSTGWMPEMVEAEGLAPSQPGRAARLQRAAIAALPRFGKWGLERDSHPRPSPYEGAALTAAPSSHGGPPR